MTTKLWSSSRQWKRKQKYLAKWKRKATEAWNARLPADRSSKGSCLAKGAMRNIYTQSRSPFFSKLPLEIRKQIYSETMEGEEFLFRVVNENKRINGDERPNKKIPFKLTCSGARGILGFPTSCKLAYLEAADYVYTSNTFQFSGTTPFWCFRRLVSNRNLDLIETLHLQYTYGEAYKLNDLIIGPAPYGPETWQATCIEISRLVHLKQLRIDVIFMAHYVDATHENVFYDALKCLGEGVKVEVRVPWRRDEYSVPEGQVLPFHLTREVTFQETTNGWFCSPDKELEQL